MGEKLIAFFQVIDYSDITMQRKLIWSEYPIINK